MSQEGKIKIALVGVGNCASAMLQGAEFYKNGEQLGLKHAFLGKYSLKDVEFVCAFDVNAEKVGRDLSEAIFTPPNNTVKFADVPEIGVDVIRGPTLDGIGGSLRNMIQISRAPIANVADKLEDNDAEIVVNLLPSGAVKASEWYAEQALKAGCAFINVTPSFTASNRRIIQSYEKNGLPIVGDDLIDQVGATIIHKMLVKTLMKQGIHILETYQLDVGGGTESISTLERARKTKRNVKTKTIESVLPYKASVVAGSTDFVDFLQNRRDSYFWIRGAYFGKNPLQLDVRLNTVDAPNACSILFDVVRAVKISLNKGISGFLTTVSAYAFKHPPHNLPLDKVHNEFYRFVEEK